MVKEQVGYVVQCWPGRHQSARFLLVIQNQPLGFQESSIPCLETDANEEAQVYRNTNRIGKGLGAMEWRERRTVKDRETPSTHREGGELLREHLRAPHGR